MTSFDPQPHAREEQEKATLQVDLYGFKGRITPADVEEARPETWKETWRAINNRLKRIAVAPFELTCEVFTGARRIIAGATRIPGAISRRIEGAHNKADRALAHKEEKLEAKPARALPRSQESAEGLKSILLELQAKGIRAGLTSVGDGIWVIVAVRQECVDAARVVGAEALEESRALPAPVGAQEAMALESVAGTQATQQPNSRKSKRKRRRR